MTLERSWFTCLLKLQKARAISFIAEDHVRDHPNATVGETGPGRPPAGTNEKALLGEPALTRQYQFTVKIPFLP